MGKKLVIVESPAKVKTINKILGPDFLVKSSLGHIRDLPLRNLGVDIEKHFTPKYVMAVGKTRVVSELKKAAAECDSIYLAPDPDREGEAIAWHLQAVLSRGNSDKPFHRVRFNEITASAVREAFKHPTAINDNLVGAQQARRVLDRIVGYMVSPLLWRRISRGLSAGRVQSVALRLICEREDEIRRFVPEEYWVLGAVVRKQVPPQDPFRIKLTRVNGEKADVRSGEGAGAVRQDLEGRPLRVDEIGIREITRRAPPPFITSTLQQAASSQCGFSPKRTMMIAQRLYEGMDLGEGAAGLITYMRTDSVSVSREAQESAREFIVKELGAEFYPEKPNVFKSRSSAQEAHEAIRPTDVRRVPESLESVLDPMQMRLYRLIWKRFVASQMAPAILKQRSVKIEAVPTGGRTNTYLFNASDTSVKFPGYMRVSGTDLPKEDDEDERAGRVPELAEGEMLDCLEWLADRKETQPPPRFTETALVGALESNGVGRPSTYAQIISTLLDRKYVREEKRTLFPSELGGKVNALLVETLNELFDVKFTAAMEEKLDKVEEGSVEWHAMLQEFYGKFEGWMDKVKAPEADADVVTKLLAALEPVTAWGPEVQSGKRTYGDRVFVDSVRTQHQEGTRKISQRQLDTLMRIACVYREQSPAIVEVITAAGKADVLNEPAPQPPSAATVRKLALLKALELGASAQKFVKSLDGRVSRGTALSEAQARALDQILLSYAHQIPDFEQIKGDLEVREIPRQESEESRALVEGLRAVKTWKPPVQRGVKTFDDSAFFRSLAEQFDRKGFLSERQVAAMRKMVKRYREQIPNHEALTGAAPAAPAGDGLKDGGTPA